MSQSNTIAADLLVRMNQSVLALPPKPPKTQTEAMEYMSPAFKQAMKRGYSLEEIQAHIQKEFGLTLQMSKMKRSVLPSDNAQADAVAKPKKTRKPKQKDTPPALDNNESGSVATATDIEKTEEDITKIQIDSADTEQSSAPESPETTSSNEAEAPSSIADATAQNEVAAPQLPPIILNESVELRFPKHEKDQAKKLGAKWDNDKGAWCAPAGIDLVPLEKWLPNPLDTYREQAMGQATDTSYERL